MKNMQPDRAAAISSSFGKKVRTEGPLEIRAISLTLCDEVRVVANRLNPELLAQASRVAVNGGGNFTGPLGECRAAITYCGGSALISLKLNGTRTPVGLAVVTWSELLASFAWGELFRVYSESQANPTPQVSRRLTELSVLPRLGTFLWPAFTQSAELELLALAEPTFWVLAFAVIANQKGEPLN